MATLRFAFECPRTWEALDATADPAIRHCGDCNKPVHLSKNAKEALAHGRAGHCVAVPTSTPAAMPRSGLGTIAGKLASALRAVLRKLTGRSASPLPPPPDPEPKGLQGKTIGVIRPFDDGRPTVGWLVPIEGPQRGQSFTLGTGTFTIGRGADATVRIDDAELLDEHCRIVVKDKIYTLHPGSLEHGTFVNARKLERAHELVDNDYIRIGETLIIFKSIN